MLFNLLIDLIGLLANKKTNKRQDKSYLPE